MKKIYLNFLSLFLITVFLLTTGFGCKITSKEVKEKMQPITLKYWRLWDDSDAFDEIISNYRQIHPNIKIEYRKFRFDEYEEALLDAWAEDRGPDIFSVHESWIKNYQSKIEPIPSEISMAYMVEKGGLKKEIIPELRVKKSITIRELKEQFADSVFDDVVLDNKIYGLPLSLETLIMFYNRDILNRASIAQPPKTWDEFQEAVSSITKFNANDEIVLSGTAMGTGYNINRAPDILSILMMQNGAFMTDSNGFATFANQLRETGTSPGIGAINFYLDFASPVKNVYCWNKDKENSLDAFLSGKVGMIFGYSYDLPIIRARAPKLNFAVAPIPQVNLNNPQNFSNYWVETVAKKSDHSSEAWDFLLFSIQDEQIKKYLAKTNRPTALKSLINSQLDDEDLYAPASQTLTAKNWYQGKDILATEEALRSMVENIAEAIDERQINEVIKNTISKINQTVR